jgi:Uma2 family endonuclease
VPSSIATAYKMTAAEFFSLPEGPPYFQLIDGDLYLSPSPRRFHQKLVVRLVGLLHSYLERHPIGEIYVAPSDVVFTEDTILNPDIYFVSRERAGILTEQGAEGAPDLVVEVLSPGTATLDLGRKREVYAESGVREMWVVSPKTRGVEVYRFAENASEPAAILIEGGTLASALFPDLAVRISDLFAA